MKLLTYWRDDNGCNLGGSTARDLLFHTGKSFDKTDLSLYKSFLKYISKARETDFFLSSMKHQNG